MKTIQRQSPMRTRCSLLLWPISLLTGGWHATHCLFDGLYEVDGIKWELLFSARLPRLKYPTPPISKNGAWFIAISMSLSSKVPHVDKSSTYIPSSSSSLLLSARCSWESWKILHTSPETKCFSGDFFFSPLSVFGVFFLHFCSPSGYTVPHHHRHRSHPARQQRGKRQQQPFPSVFHCHALKIAPKQLHHRLLNKWIYTPLQAFSWRHSTIRDWTQRKCETPSTQT